MEASSGLEATRLLKLNSATLLKMLAHYGGPAKLAADPQAAERLAGWGRHVLLPSKIAQVIASAAATVGVPPVARETQRIKRYAKLALAARRGPCRLPPHEAGTKARRRETKIAAKAP